ncbi:MAG: [glutamine synthetase] adenylyltransferase / [glutamine synthetase]-adenylyl-L-tyrosine [Frankiaceae bacterium]|nr:[glutamine synthetase] adenylyltransferase / [glutamine synthetase]-adenylyl-L-tyrosine [Frankiaceae bacterium]
MTVGEHPRPGRATDRARLVRLGFADASSAAAVIDRIALDDEWLLVVAESADPDRALAGLAALLEVSPHVLAVGPEARARLVAVLASSPALADHLVRHPEQLGALTDDAVALTRPSAYGLRTSMTRAVEGRRGVEARDALRVAYRRHLLGLAARDLSGTVELDEVAAELADLAGATLEAALVIARAELPAASADCRLAVIGLGKCGGRELNYVSDVDVVFVAEPVEGGDEAAALRTATALASALMEACSAATPEGTIWPVDAALRPEGKAGPLVRTLASHEAYYRRWAHTWEFQALLKARPVAGDQELGNAYVERLAPLVWTAGGRPNFVEDVQAMRRRVEGTLPADAADRELKLGPGGLRDVEFAVQLLQLVHGRSDESLHSGTTLVALEALASGGYVGREDARGLGAAYRFLRTLEHRIQLHRLRRTHVMPDDPVDLRRLGRAMGLGGDPAVELEKARARHAVEVRRLHEKLFYRPLLAAVARLRTDEARLTPEQAGARLQALGYVDPAGALRHIEALTSGVSRRAAIQRTLLPVMLGWFADAVDADAGLLAFRRLSDELGATPWYLRLLRDEGAAAERLARVLAGSRYAADLLTRAPEAVAMLAKDSDLRPRSGAALLGEALAAVRRRDDWEAAVLTVRGIRRRELVRTAAADLLGLRAQDEVRAALTDVTTTAIAAALRVAVRKVEVERRSPLPCRLAVIAMGRLGGAEQGYGSDADVLFVHDPLEGVTDDVAAQAAHDVANELRRLLALPAPDPALVVDADLRPEGKQGPLTRSLASYGQYYARWSLVWEAQALLRAAPVAGDDDLGRAFVRLIDPLRYPEGGLAEVDVREVRRIKARVEAERLPRGADPSLHTKLGRGGLADVEWTVQLLQLRHAHEVEGLRTTGTLRALHAARDAGLVSPPDAEALEQAWRLASRVRDGIMLSRGRPGDSLPTDVRELAAVARAVGYPAGRVADLLEDYRRATRRARAVVERVFYA